MFDSSIELHKYYLSEAQRLCVNATRVLKTDLDNEVYGSPVLGGIAANLKCEVYAIEYDPRIAADGSNNVHSVVGDIRELPYEDSYFDVVVDLSTIDHIPPEDLPKTLTGYARVLKEKGKLLMFAWCGHGIHPDVWKPDNQYYFDKEELLGVIEKHFTIQEMGVVYMVDSNQMLKVIGTKR